MLCVETGSHNNSLTQRTADQVRRTQLLVGQQRKTLAHIGTQTDTDDEREHRPPGGVVRGDVDQVERDLVAWDRMTWVLVRVM